VVIEVDGMGVGMLVILKDGKYDIPDVPHIEGLVEKRMGGVGPMEIRGGNVDIMRMP
jgi:hypothetical protein